MATEIKQANPMLLEAAWKIDQGTVTMEDCAMAKLFCSEMLARVADQSLQMVGGMGLMDNLPLERICVMRGSNASGMEHLKFNATSSHGLCSDPWGHESGTTF